MSASPNFKKISVHAGPKQSPGFLLWHVSTAWRCAIESTLKSFGLTHPQFVVLAATGWLTRNGEFATQAAIGQMAGLDPNTASQVMRGLEKKGLVNREISTDARAKHPKLTLQGNKLLAKALPAVERQDSKFFSSCSPKEMAGLTSLFQKFVD